MIVTIKEGDTYPPLRAYLHQSDGKPIRVTGGVVKLLMRDKDNVLTINKPVEIIDPEKGYVRYDWLTADTKTAGEYQAEFEITFQNGVKLSVPNDGYFTVNITKQIG